MEYDYLNRFDGRALPRDLRSVARFQVAQPIVHQLEAEGLSVELVNGLAPLYEANRSDPTRKRIVHHYDMAFHPHRDPNDTVTLAVRYGDELVACAAGIAAWVETDLASELRALEHFYEEPKHMAKSGDCCIVTAPTASLIRHCSIAWSAGFWTAEEHSRPSSILPVAAIRLLHLWLLTHWRFSYLVGMGREPIARRYAVKLDGMPSCELGLWIPGTAPLKERERWLFIAPRDYLRWNFLRPEAADLNRPLGQPSEPTAVSAAKAA
jgi:hypothetical protein